MPIYSAFFTLFMFASIGLPGLSGFVGEFLVALGAWDYNPAVALFTFAVVIFAAWYMMWMFQRIVFGRAPGEAPDPGDGELTADERAELAALGDHGHGHGGHGHATPLPVSGGSHEHVADAAHAGQGHDDHGGLTLDKDLTRKEILTLFPLAVATIVFGVYPKPVFDIVEPSFQRILAPFI
jgi:NADH-quinone oxidoreductase subunit M